MRKLSIPLFFALFTLSSLVLQAQDDGVLTATQKYLNAVSNNEVDKITELTYPGIIEMGGGVEYFKESVAQDNKQLADSGLKTIETAVQSEGEPIETEKGFFVLVPYKWVVDFGEATYVSTAHILANTQDGGESWTFVNLQKHTSESLKVFIPELPAGFVVPATTPFEELR